MKVTAMTDRLAELSAAGVAVWLDDLSRVAADHRRAGQAAPRAARGRGDHQPDHLRQGAGATPTTTTSSSQDLAVRAASTVEEAVRMITTLRRAVGVRRDAPGVRRVGAASTAGSRSRSTRGWPHDTDKTVAEAKALWWLVDRPNLFIKIPATEAGLPAITATLAEGISVNVTLIFWLERYEAVMDAFLAGLEQAKANGHDLSKIGSVASFFVSRVDTEVDKRLDKIGTPTRRKALHGKAAIANAQLAYERYERGLRHRPLAGAGRRRRPPAAAAVGVHLDEEPGLPGRHLRRGADRARARSTPCRRRSSTRSPTTARSAPTPSPARTTTPSRSSPTCRARHRHGRRGRDPGARGRGEVRGQLEGAARRRQQVAHRLGRRPEPTRADAWPGLTARERSPTGRDCEDRRTISREPRQDRARDQSAA